MPHSKHQRNFTLFLLLAAVIAVSGCVGQPGGITPGPGVQITDFVPDFSSVQSGESVKLQIKVQNAGGTTARNAIVELAGINPSEWNTQAQQSFGDLSPVDLQTNTPGETQIKTFSMKAPALPKGIQHTFNPVAKVTYNYQTKAIKGVTLVSVDELRRMTQEGRSPPVREVQSSGGPISVDVKTGDVIKTGGGRDTVQFFISLTNTQWSSGGTVIPQGGSGSFDHPMTMSVTSSGVQIGSCSFANSNGNSGTVDLWQGKDGQVTCQLDVTGNGPTYSAETLVTITLDYRYQIEKSTAISVIGTSKS